MTEQKKQKRARTKRRKVLLFGRWTDEPMMDAVTAAAERYDWDLLDRRYLMTQGLGRDYEPDGVLITGEPMPSDPLVQSFTKRAPMVLAGFPEWANGAKIPVVAEHSEAIGRLGADHFLERGFKTVGLIAQACDWEGSEAQRIYSALQERAAGGGIECLKPLFLTNMDTGSDVTRLAKIAAWRKTVSGHVGVLVCRDILAGHVCAAFQALGISVPEEIAVLGIGNVKKFCMVSPCPLSSVDPDHAGIGAEAARILQCMMSGEEVAPETTRMPPSHVVTRRSTDILAVADVVVARALRFIWEHFAEPLSVADIAAAADVSCATLERKFRKQVGRTVSKELIRKRLEVSAALLVTEDIPIVELAGRVGILSRSYLNRAFRQQFGMTPRDYRKQRAR